jgi:DNA-directed RNA polymerase sigma subunit (sigma70/sigma32)
LCLHPGDAQDIADLGLTEREVAVLAMAFYDRDGLRVIGNRLGVSREMARKILQRATRKVEAKGHTLPQRPKAKT